MLNLQQEYNIEVESAYIIVVKDNPTSEKMFLRCVKSCEDVGMPWKRWEAFDGTSGSIATPDHLKNEKWLSWIKQANDALTPTEVALMLTSISLWQHCIHINKPIVILEHDAVMIKKITDHPLFNSIVYLGCKEQYDKKMAVNSIPIHGTIGKNYHFIWRAHAYLIDPQVAKNMVSYVLKQGIFESLDIMIRADIFSIVQLDLCAYDLPEIENTTITDRKKTLAGFKKS